MSQALRDAWRALLAQPMQFVAEECLEAALLGAVPRERVIDLARQPRFEARIGGLLASYYGLEPLASVGQIADDDLPVLLLSRQRFARLALSCGACQHADFLAREIRGPVVQKLRAHLGDEVYDLAVSWREPVVGQQAIIEDDALLAAIDRDGQRCVDAWLAAQPAPLQAWLRLRFDLAAPLSTGGAEDIQRVRQVACALTSHEEQGAA
ncbi:type III secretion protein [Pseudomonas daroniae]|uniref:Type III secretion protein n=1 Tax=Phytopseudomonas daroniae TaxID=2487519 RepID=A0A4Q9QRU0_9GAMM|nr:MULTISPECIES: type III secretion protein [Pseudomonas]TBU83155.1 type III secretion protein [Pseudomonas sp. FRB 228]TBU83831.1 type III secretion protein [Pseudomonas daroniae]TBU93008.1 type III secretion protein [Pseudomonas daroniae]